MKRVLTVVLAVGAVAAASALFASGAGKGDAGERAKAATKASIAVAKETNAKLVDMAKVSLQDAITAALAKVPGKAWKAELEAEDGSLIFTIQVVDQDGKWQEIAVDAGNGSVLNVENGDQDEFEGVVKGEKKEGKDSEKEGKGSDDNED